MSDVEYMEIILHASNGISTILAAVTVYLYFWLPNVQDIHGTCVFHYSLNIAILHAAVTYQLITGSNILPGTLCFLEVHVMIFVLTAINTWSIILSYNTWKQIPRTGLATVNPRRRLNYYRFIGYGAPFLYQLLIIKSHLSAPDELDNYSACLMILMFSILFPIACSTLMNLFYFGDSQRRLRNLLSSIAASEHESPGDKILLKRLTYKFHLNLKLCATMNIPFAISIILAIVLREYRYMKLLPFFIAAFQGTFIFLAAVVFRKRVIKGLVRHGDKLCVGCIRPAIPDVRRSVDDEDETDCDEASCAEEDRAAAASPNFPI